MSRKSCFMCGNPIWDESLMCMACAPKHPIVYERQRELLKLLTPLVMRRIDGLQVVAVKPLMRAVLEELPLEEMITNKSTTSRLIKYILRQEGFVVVEESSPHSVWMERVEVAVEV